MGGDFEVGFGAGTGAGGAAAGGVAAWDSDFGFATTAAGGGGAGATGVVTTGVDAGASSVTAAAGGRITLTTTVLAGAAAGAGSFVSTNHRPIAATSTPPTAKPPMIALLTLLFTRMLGAVVRPTIGPRTTRGGEGEGSSGNVSTPPRTDTGARCTVTASREEGTPDDGGIDRSSSVDDTSSLPADANVGAAFGGQTGSVWLTTTAFGCVPM